MVLEITNKVHSARDNLQKEFLHRVRTWTDSSFLVEDSDSSEKFTMAISSQFSK